MMLNPNILIRRRLVLLSTSLCVLFFAAHLVGAQSGRRSAEKNKTPVPVETPVPAPVPTPSEKAPVKPEFVLRVVSNTSRTLSMRLPFPGKMSSWVIDRLEDSLLLEVRSGGEGTMKEAERMAKNSEAYVVYIELAEDPFSNPNDRSTRIEDDSIWIDFAVFAPGTGKTKQRGKTYFRTSRYNRTGTVMRRKNICNASVSNEDFILLEASFETAERIIAGFGLPVPAIKCDRTF